ncbi:MAG: RNA polymerase sigma factor [Planctomycetes bacterium]|nr:RNA polymerase sigma factor [Planctomycetota bacterium]MCB9889502.1 RNA polymerase sigma factor [Planctomycetota bacterium]
MEIAHSQAPDEPLVSQALQGSREAFGLLVVRYSRSVRAVLVARLGACDDLDDLVQECFLRAYRGLSRLRTPERFGAYLHRIARNLAVDWLRRGPRGTVPLEDAPVVLDAPVEGLVDIREERLARVRRVVGRLPLALREAVMMFYFDRLSHGQIAAFLGITEGAVNQRLHRARVALRSALDGGGEEGS